MKNAISFTRTISFKLMLVGFLSLMLLIPAAWIRSIINERQQRSQEVSKEISSMWGEDQTIAGPVLSIPFKKFYDLEGKKTFLRTEVVHFLPELLDVDVKIDPSLRYRGIFKVVVFNAVIKVRGSFIPPDFKGLGINPEDVDVENAVLTFGIPDMRGILHDVQFKWNENQIAVAPGSVYKGIIHSGFHVNLNKNDISTDKSSAFSMDLSLNGSNSFGFYPLGKTTNVSIRSSWTDPGFEGAFLPTNRNINESGFDANWQVTHLNRNFPQFWLNDEYDLKGSSSGVGFILPVNHYQKSERSSKYAIMFIALTFLLFLLIEILNKKRIHPIQYLLVGFAIILFYILLVSISEQMAFNQAFLISSLAIILHKKPIYHLRPFRRAYLY